MRSVIRACVTAEIRQRPSDELREDAERTFLSLNDADAAVNEMILRSDRVLGMDLRILSEVARRTRPDLSDRVDREIRQSSQFFFPCHHGIVSSKRRTSS